MKIQSSQLAATGPNRRDQRLEFGPNSVEEGKVVHEGAQAQDCRQRLRRKFDCLLIGDMLDRKRDVSDELTEVWAEEESIDEVGRVAKMLVLLGEIVVVNFLPVNPIPIDVDFAVADSDLLPRDRVQTLLARESCARRGSSCRGRRMERRGCYTGGGRVCGR